MSEKLQWKPRVVSAKDLAEEMSSAAALGIPPQLGAAGPARLTTVSAIRLAAWRELTTHWMFLLIMPLCLGLGVVLPEEIGLSWSAFLMVTVIPILLVMSAAGGSAPADSFWRGLRGPVWANLFGRQLVHLLMLGIPAFVTALSLIESGKLISFVDTDLHLQLLLLGTGVFYATLYTSVSAARTRLVGMHILAGPIAGVGIIGISSLLSFLFIQDWPILLGLCVRMGMFALVALVATYLWESRVGVWGAAVLRRGRWSPLLWGGALLATMTGVEQAWSFGVLPVGYQPSHIAQDGSQILYTNTLRELDNGRVWSWTPEQGYHRLALRFNEGTFAGPGGALLYQMDGQIVLEQGGVAQSCAFDDDIRYVEWSPSGGGAVASREGRSNYLIEGGGQPCAPVMAMGWQGDELVYEAGGAIHWGDQRVSLPTDGELTSLSWHRGQLFPHETPSGAYQAVITDGVLSVTGPHTLDVQDDPALTTLPQSNLWLNHRQVVNMEQELVMDLHRGLSWSYSGLARPTFFEPGMAFTPDGELIYFSEEGAMVRVPATGTR